MLRIASTNQVNEKDANQYLVGDPQVTFFKSVFRRHTNFAMESFNIPVRNNINLKSSQSTLVVYEIPNYGDLLGKMYLKLSIPPMKTDTEKKFKFNDYLGFQMIENIKLKINGVVVDNINGEMLYILHKLRNRDEKQKLESKLINPVQGKHYLYNSSNTSDGHSKTFTNKYYNSPIYTEHQTIYVPLQFSFSNYSKTFLPLFLLENKAIQIEILLRETNSIYTIEKKDKDYWYYDKVDDVSASGYPLGVTDPSGYTSRKIALDNTLTANFLTNPPLHGEQTTFDPSGSKAFYLKRYESRYRSRPTTIEEDISQFTYNGAIFEVNPTLEVTQVFLTNDEKLEFKSRSNDYLIEQIYTKKELNIGGGQTHSWVVDNHTNLVKELYITITRNDNKDRNQFLNYTNYDEMGTTEEKIIKYQDNWWYDSIRASESPETDEAIEITSGFITITPDRFQEFLFRYGPYGEAQNDFANGVSGWSHKIERQHSVYTIEQIYEFRNIWKYRKASEIPKIDKDNFNTIFKESPLRDMQILFDGLEREDIKDNTFFNVIQPYNYHTNFIDPGIYTYSFSLYPEQFQPSGFCNMNLFRRVQYRMNLRDTEDKLNPSVNEEQKKYRYNITLYSLKYNFIKIIDKVIVPLFSLQT